MKQFSDFGIKLKNSHFVGDKIRIAKVFNREIIIHGYKIEPSKFKDKSENRLCLQIELNNEKHIIFTSSTVLKDQITQVTDDLFPFRATITQVGEHFEFM